MQSLMRNPLASPYTLGVSNGAAFGAALAMLWGGGTLGAGFSFLGYSCGGHERLCIRLSVARHCLCGIQAVRRKSERSHPDGLCYRQPVFGRNFHIKVSLFGGGAENLDIWLMGGFWASNWKSVLTVLPFCLLSLLFTLRFAWDFNAMNAGRIDRGYAGRACEAVKSSFPHSGYA